MNARYQVCKIYFCIDVQIQKIPIVSVLKENVLGLDHRFGHLSALQGGLACRPGIYSRPAPPGNESPGYKPNPAEAGCSRFGSHIGRNDDRGHILLVVASVVNVAIPAVFKRDLFFHYGPARPAPDAAGFDFDLVIDALTRCAINRANGSMSASMLALSSAAR